MGIPGGEENEKGIEAIFQAMMTKNFPKLISDTKSNTLEIQRTPGRINAKNKRNKQKYS